MKTIIDHAKSAISHLAIFFPIINGDDGGVEFEAFDDCKIDTVFAQIGVRFIPIPFEAETHKTHSPSLNDEAEAVTIQRSIAVCSGTLKT